MSGVLGPNQFDAYLNMLTITGIYEKKQNAKVCGHTFLFREDLIVRVG